MEEQERQYRWREWAAVLGTTASFLVIQLFTGSLDNEFLLLMLLFSLGMGIYHRFKCEK